jgi:hypothetical protein
MHTKGPWKATEGVNNYPDWNVRDSNGWLIVTCPLEANARLIAESPTMLLSLENIRRINKGEHPERQRMIEAICDEAINKATE